MSRETPKTPDFHESARRKFLALGLDSTRKSYYPQLKAQLEKAKKDERRLQLLIDTLPAHISYIDCEEKFILVNRAFETALNKNRKEIIGKPIKQVIDYKSYARLKPYIESALAGGTGRFEFSVTPPKRANKCYEINYVPEKDDSGRINGFCVMTIDVTDKKQEEKKKARLEASLRQAQKMEAIGTLSGGIAHDFNNILSGIFGYSQLIDLNADNPEKVRANNQKLIEGARRATELVRQILTFSRKTEYSRQPLYLYAILKEALKLLRSTIPVTIDIKTEILSRHTILADATQIHQVIMNLCTNAYHAMGEKGGTLYIGLKEAVPGKTLMAAREFKSDVPCICLEISDTGPGIDPKIKERIFDPYFTTKGQNKGTGLGLAIVSGIVEQHEGAIEFDTAPGTGTRFRLYFPILEEAQRKNRQPRTHPRNPSKKTTANIMVVDDEDSITQTLSVILSNQGHRVTPFDNGASALAAFKEKPEAFNLVITDMTMPGITGDKLAIKLLEIKPDTPIIICTGFHEQFTEADAMAAGIAKFLQKPVTGSELSAVIQELIDQEST